MKGYEEHPKEVCGVKSFLSKLFDAAGDGFVNGF